MAPLRILFASVMLLGSAAVSAHDYHGGDLDIAHPWSRPLPPVATTGVAYLTVTNKGETDDVLLSADSPIAEKVEIHTHIKDGDVMKMRQLNELVIPAGGEQTLAPGGHHLMLMGLKQVSAAGERFPLTLHFKEAGDLEVEVAVDAEPAKAQGHGHDQH
ncbi:copper chaperone PCu(A)C [uncultured Oceanisphaera sp.]|uniref:copper chaperone PCu(A)C n=1 Tax=uncultured Oceanisphaera sp. TaxID=353858 RepID=UPI0026112C1D|nr:copper chaperone PCu(A)C [uncultured Oceanisphaera sp.]